MLVRTTVSNWGAHGVSACLAILLKDQDVFHGPEVEKRILEQTSRAGFFDAISGYVEPGADGLAVEVHCQIVSLLKLIVKKECR